jgi:hypothetical protein
MLIVDTFLPETERQRHIELVNTIQWKIDSKKFHLTQNKEKSSVYTKQNAMDYLMKNVFTSKKNTNY